MLRNKREEKDKEIRALVREMDELHDVIWNAPIVKLDKPYQNGWVKCHVVRDDFTRRNDAEVFHRILKKVGGSAFSRREDFKGRDGKEYGPSLYIIGENEWKTLGWPDYYAKHFHFGWHRIYSYDGFEYGGHLRKGYAVLRPFCFDTVVKPHFITHVRKVIPEAESRLQEIRNQFENNQYWRRYFKIKGKSGNYSADYELARQRYLDALGTKEIEHYDVYGII